MAAEVVGEGTPRERWLVYPTIVEEVSGQQTRKIMKMQKHMLKELENILILVQQKKEKKRILEQ